MIRGVTGHDGLVVIGDLGETLDLIALIDAELGRERRARPVKVRRRGCSPGELVVSLAECQLVGCNRERLLGGECARIALCATGMIDNCSPI